MYEFIEKCLNHIESEINIEQESIKLLGCLQNGKHNIQKALFGLYDTDKTYFEFFKHDDYDTMEVSVYEVCEIDMDVRGPLLSCIDKYITNVNDRKIAYIKTSYYTTYDDPTQMSEEIIEMIAKDTYDSIVDKFNFGDL